MIPSNTMHMQVRLVLQLNVKIAKTLDAFSPRYGFTAVPEPQASQLTDWALLMAQLYTQLLKRCKSEGQQLFNMTSKTHFALHSILCAKYLHPSLV